MEITRHSGFTQITTSGGGLQAAAPNLAVLDVPSTADPQGLYVHIPFCFHKCHYCDFYSLVDDDRIEAFVERLDAELVALGTLGSSALSAVFVGGGTPTLLPPAALGRVLDRLSTSFALTGEVEITVEANPETVSPEIAATLAAGGVNRVSVGCQSFDPALLKMLERHHDPTSVTTAVDRLRAAGIDNINLDLIFGIPGQTLAGWREDLDAALALAPDHVSCYGLMYEPNTALTARLRSGAVEAVDEDVDAAMYEHVMARLAEAGYEHYEISAWARPGRRCRLNLLYWTNADWWAAGPSAAGHLAGLRWRNVPRLGDYLRADPWPPITDVEPPDPRRALVETLMMGLRLNDGVPTEKVERLLDAVDDPAPTRAAIAAAVEEGTLTQDGALRLTARGLMIADRVIAGLF